MFYSIILSLALSLFAEAQNCNGFFSSSILSVQQSEVSIQETFFKTGAQRHLVFSEVKTLNQKTITELELFGENSDLIIGIDVTGNTQGHMYLIVQGVRFDGRMFFASPTYQKTDWTINKGLLIRYREVPTENKTALLNWLNSEPIIRTPTCVAAACRVLYDHANFGGAPSRHHWFPSTFLKNLLNQRLVGSDGNPIEPEIYTINSDIRQFWDNLPSWIKVPGFIFKVLFDPYTWKGAKKNKK